VNRGDATTYVLDRLQIPSAEAAKVTQVQNVIQQEVYRTNAEWNLTMASTTVTIAATTGLVTLPSDLQKLVALTQTTVTVDVVDEMTFASTQAAITAGTFTAVTNPPTIAVYRPPSTLATLPVPTANVSATLVYVQRPAAMTSDATAIPLPLEYHDYVAESAVWRMALTEGEIFIARFSSEVMQDLRARLSGLHNIAPGQNGWAIPLRGYPS
jgi:hypothetical protein